MEHEKEKASRKGKQLSIQLLPLPKMKKKGVQQPNVLQAYEARLRYIRQQLKFERN